jgi:DNA-binding transcriptional ArsR family regulator
VHDDAPAVLESSMTPTDPDSGQSRPRRSKRSDEAAARLMKALGHPMRMRILMRLSQKVMSPNQLAQELEERLGSVSYHVRVLVEIGYLELVRTEPRRGAVEHFYRAQARAFLTDSDWERLPDKTRKALSDSVLQTLWRDVGIAVATGTFDERLDRHLSFTQIVLDEDGWTKLKTEVDRVLELAIDLQNESAARLQDGNKGGAEVFGRLGALLYTAPPSEPAV